MRREEKRQKRRENRRQKFGKLAIPFVNFTHSRPLTRPLTLDLSPTPCTHTRTMFRKPLEKRGVTTKVKKSVVRNMRKELQTKYPLLNAEQAELLLPASGTITQQKLEGHMAIYYRDEDNVPVLFTTKPKGEREQLLPTMYSAHLAPQMMPTVTVGPSVETVICQRHARLFMPGVVVAQAKPGRSWVQASFGKFKKGDKVLLKEVGKWYPFAIGEWLLDYKDLEIKGQEGESIGVVHHIDDSLWLEGHARIPTQKPDSVGKATAEFEEKIAAWLEDRKDLAKEQRKLVKLQRAIHDLLAKQRRGEKLGDDLLSKLARKQEVESKLADVSQRLQSEDERLGVTPAMVAAHNRPHDSESSAEQSGEGQLGQQQAQQQEEQVEEQHMQQHEPTETQPEQERTEESSEQHQQEAPAQEQPQEQLEEQEEQPQEQLEEQPEEQPQEPEKTPEELARLSLFLAAKTTLSAAELPLLASALTANHIKPAAKRVGFDFQIKKTKWKKIGVFLKELEGEGFLVLSEAVKGKLMLESIDYSSSHLMFDVDDVVRSGSGDGDDDDDDDDDNDAMFLSAAKQKELTKKQKQQRASKSGKVTRDKKILVEKKRVKGRVHVFASRWDQLGFDATDEDVSTLKKWMSCAVEKELMPGQKQRPKNLKHWLVFHCKLPSMAVDAMCKLWGLSAKHFDVRN